MDGAGAAFRRPSHGLGEKTVRACLNPVALLPSAFFADCTLFAGTLSHVDGRLVRSESQSAEQPIPVDRRCRVAGDCAVLPAGVPALAGIEGGGGRGDRRDPHRLARVQDAAGDGVLVVRLRGGLRPAADRMDGLQRDAGLQHHRRDGTVPQHSAIDLQPVEGWPGPGRADRLRLRGLPGGLGRVGRPRGRVRGDARRPRLSAAAGGRHLPDREHLARRLRRPRHADSGAGRRDRPARGDPQRDGRPAVAVFVVHHSLLHGEGDVHLAANLPGLAGAAGGRRVVRRVSVCLRLFPHPAVCEGHPDFPRHRRGRQHSVDGRAGDLPAVLEAETRMEL